MIAVRGDSVVSPTESSPVSLLQPVARVGIRRDQVLVLGRYLFVFRPVFDSILDTIFWGDGYKSIAHVFLLSYLTYHHLCGIRFMMLFTTFHVFMKAGKRSECSEEEAVFLFKATVHDLTIVLRRYNPSLKYVWPFLVALIGCGLWLEILLKQSALEWLDMSIGPISVIVILICYGLVDPRYTRNYTVANSSIHSRTGSAGGGGGGGGGGGAGSEWSKGSHSSFQRKDGAPAGATESQLKISELAAEGSPVFPPASMKSLPSRYSAQVTPTAPWDELMPCCPTLPVFMHKVLMLYTRAPKWSDWKRTSDWYGRNHPIEWTVVKAGLNVATVKGVSFDDAVNFVNDDPTFSKPLEKLNLWKFDKILGEFRRLAVIDANTRVVHMVYKQIIFGVAPRDAPMYQCAKELTREEIDYYGLCRPHINNKEVTDGTGRIFVLSSAPADGVDAVQGHVRCLVHRQALIIREIPNALEVMTLVCGEPGGNVPSRIVDMARGEQMKIVTDLRKALLDSCKKKQ